eukprot:2313030-Rhodomonas_salina.1
MAVQLETRASWCVCTRGTCRDVMPVFLVPGYPPALLGDMHGNVHRNSYSAGSLCSLCAGCDRLRFEVVYTPMDVLGLHHQLRSRAKRPLQSRVVCSNSSEKFQSWDAFSVSQLRATAVNAFSGHFRLCLECAWQLANGFATAAEGELRRGA